MGHAACPGFGLYVRGRARLVALGLEEAREAELLAHSPEEREAVRREEVLSSLLDRISERRYGLV